MKMNVSFRNLGEVGSKLLRLSHQLEESLVDVKNTMAEEVKKEAVRSIEEGPKTGRIYRRENPSRIHQASAPGEAPADDLGNLKNSITVSPSTRHNVPAKVGSPLPYAADLEHGTPKILPRPWLWPAIEIVGSRTMNIFEERLRRIVR